MPGWDGLQFLEDEGTGCQSFLPVLLVCVVYILFTVNGQRMPEGCQNQI